TRQSRVHGQPGQLATDVGELRLPARLRRLDRSELVQQIHPVPYIAAIRRLHEREGRDVPQPDRGYLQDHRRQVRAQDLRLGELRTPREVRLRIKPDTH